MHGHCIISSTPFLISGLVTLLLVVHLWAKHATDTLLSKVFWTLILLLPMIGWVFYWIFYAPPPVQGGADRAQEESNGLG